MILSLSCGCFAQVDRSSLNGTVRDVSGRVIPGAAVRATETDTGLEQIEPRPSGVLLVRRQQPRGIVVGRFEDAAAIERFLPANHPADLRLREERLLLPVALESEAGRRHFGQDRRAIVRTRTIHGSARDLLPTECV